MEITRRDAIWTTLMAGLAAMSGTIVPDDEPLDVTETDGIESKMLFDKAVLTPPGREVGGDNSLLVRGMSIHYSQPLQILTTRAGEKYYLAGEAAGEIVFDNVEGPLFAVQQMLGTTLPGGVIDCYMVSDFEYPEDVGLYRLQVPPQVVQTNEMTRHRTADHWQMDHLSLRISGLKPPALPLKMPVIAKRALLQNLERLITQSRLDTLKRHA